MNKKGKQIKNIKKLSSSKSKYQHGKRISKQSNASKIVKNKRTNYSDIDDDDDDDEFTLLMQTKSESSSLSSIESKTLTKKNATKLRPIKTTHKLDNRKQQHNVVKEKSIKIKNKFKSEKKKKSIQKLMKQQKSEINESSSKNIYEKAISKQVKRLTTRSELNAIADLCLKLMRFTPTESTNNAQDNITSKNVVYKSPIGVIKRYYTTTEKGESIDGIKRDITVMKIQITETIPKKINNEEASTAKPNDPPSKPIETLSIAIDNEPNFIDRSGGRNSLFYRRPDDYTDYSKERDFFGGGGLTIRFNPYLEGRPIYEQYDKQNLDMLVEIVPGLINDQTDGSYTTIDAEKTTTEAFQWNNAPVIVETPSITKTIDLGHSQLSACAERDSLFYQNPFNYPIYDDENIEDIKKWFNPYVRGSPFYINYDKNELNKLIEIVHGSSINFNDDDNEYDRMVIPKQNLENYNVNDDVRIMRKSPRSPNFLQPTIVPTKQIQKNLMLPKQQQLIQSPKQQTLMKIMAKNGKKVKSPYNNNITFNDNKLKKSPNTTTKDNLIETAINEVITFEIMIEPLNEKKKVNKMK